MKSFIGESTLEIITYIQEILQTEDEVSFIVINPDIEKEGYVQRSYKAWTDLAEILYCKILTPLLIDETTIKLTFVKLKLQNSFHEDRDLKEEKYGVNSLFFQIDKTQDPSFVFHYKRSLENVGVSKRVKILNLGINRGDEFGVIKDLIGKSFREKKFVGVDFCPSAINEGRKKFPEDNVDFLQEDINNLKDLSLGKFDLIVSIGTLQSPGIDFKKVFMSLVQDSLEDGGGVILGFPNCRWIDKEPIFGAKAPNYSFPEMTLLIKDLYFCKKYLQQKKFRVTLTGKNYIFLTATKIGLKD